MNVTISPRSIEFLQARDVVARGTGTDIELRTNSDRSVSIMIDGIENLVVDPSGLRIGSINFLPPVQPPISSFNKPPQIAKFFALLIPPKDRDGMVGDIEEEYVTVLLPQYGQRLANVYFWWQVLIACTASILQVFRGLAFGGTHKVAPGKRSDS